MTQEFDLQRGIKAEGIASRYLKERHNAVRVFPMQCYYPEFDLVAVMPRGKIKTIEVKLDEREKDTGNIAIEYLHHGSFSGILVSRADWYVIILTDKLLCMKKHDLFYLLRGRNKFDERAWDGDKSQIILLPTQELMDSGICDIWDLKTNRPVERLKERDWSKVTLGEL